MLSKSAARAFFLSGTLLFSAVFIWLTVDTFQRIPAQTNSDELSESVARGKQIWEENNCMGCHTLLGEGAYYAPELTRVYDRRGPAFIAQMLRDPEAVYPGQRRMVKYDLSEAQIDDMNAFFEWIGRMRHERLLRVDRPHGPQRLSAQTHHRFGGNGTDPDPGRRTAGDLLAGLHRMSRPRRRGRCHWARTRLRRRSLRSRVLDEVDHGPPGREARHHDAEARSHPRTTQRSRHLSLQATRVSKQREGGL